MKTITIAVCTTILILAGILAYGGRYTYQKVGSTTVRTNRYSGQVCRLSNDATNPDWRPVPQKVLDAAIAAADSSKEGMAAAAADLAAKKAAEQAASAAAASGKSILSPWPNPLDAIWAKPQPPQTSQLVSLEQAYVADATDKWNVTHNAGLSETIFGWSCQR